jgi:hypothetical protein
LTVAPAAPRLLSARIAASGGGFTLTVSGFSTPRTLTELNAVFTPAAGVSLANSQVKVNIEADAGTWFRSATSANFGGQFVVQVPFTLSGGSGTATLASLFQSATVSVTNSLGVSNTIALNFQ